MDEDRAKDEHIPRDEAAAKQEGEKNRKEMDEVPAHGTDPLHEGP